MKPSVIFTLFFSSGIVLGTFVYIPSGIFIWATAILIVVMFAAKFMRTALAVTFVLLGMFHTVVYKLPLYNDVSLIDLDRFDHQVKVRGVVISDPEEKHIKNYVKITFQLKVQEIFINDCWQKREGRLLVNLFSRNKPQYGDIVLLEGKLHYPYNFSKDTYFSYSEHLAHRGIKFILSVSKNGTMEIIGISPGGSLLKKLFEGREKLSSIYKEYLSPKESALMIALVLGQQEYIPKSLRQIFVETGTAHILAVSGFNVGVVAFVTFFILKILLFPRAFQYLLSIAVIIFYAFLTGGQSPVVRSAIMGVIFLLSFLIDKEADVLNSLALSAFILLLINPLNLFDVGFQLSFLSVYFIVIIYPAIYGWLKNILNFKENWLINQMLQSLAISLAAFVGVSGLIVYYFGIVTPISIIANLIIVPLSSLNIVLGLCLLLFHWLVPALTQPFAMCIHICLNMTVASAYFLSQIPGAFHYVPKMPEIFVYFYYCVLFLILWRSRIYNSFIKLLYI